jgi:hypothetical protein
VLAALTEVAVPETKLSFGTKPNTIPLQVVAQLTMVNQAKIPLILKRLSADAATCTDATKFREVVSQHRSRLNNLVTVIHRR